MQEDIVHSSDEEETDDIISIAVKNSAHVPKKRFSRQSKIPPLFF